MTDKKITKQQLHKRNRHKHGYDFKALAATLPALKTFIHKNNAYKNKEQNLTIDFSDAGAVKALNKALLKQYYQLEHWDIPLGYLCPPIPGRVDYIHYLSDLLTATNQGKPVNNNKISVLDIGTGASCIYPLLGHSEYQWHFIASDIDPVSIEAARHNIQANAILTSQIECRQQTNNNQIFHGIITPDERYELTLCNPPFHQSLAQANEGSQRKWQNLAIEHNNKGNNKANIINSSTAKNKAQAKLNFGGQKAELWCPGGEIAFIRNMIRESKQYRTQVLWFTCLVSKKDHLSLLKLALKKADTRQVKVIKMAQGQKISRFIAWSFLDPEQQQHWCKEHLS